MSIELHDEDTFEGTIANGSTVHLEAETSTSDHMQIMIGDSAGNIPPEYTLTEEFWQPQYDEWMRFSRNTLLTSTAIRDKARGAKVRFTVENTSGADATYRIVLQTFDEI